MAEARTLFVGDVHGCARELGKLIDKASPTRLILAGDLFTKGPDPRGVWSIIEEHRAEAVLGNHDEIVLESWREGYDLPRRAFRWLRQAPWLIEGADFIAVHAGVHPLDWRRTKRKHAVHLRRWKTQRYWWEHYRGERLVIHGHTSKLGLIDRRPYSLGLDTGCVKGGRLTGYLLEEDRLLSVPARRAYG